MLSFAVFSMQAQADKDNLRIIIPFTPGGSPDTAARFLQESLSKKLDKNLVLDYKPGAGGEIGHVELAQANPNRLTLAMTTLSVAINGINKDVQPFNLESIVPITAITVPTVIYTSPKSNIRNLQDLQNYKGHLKFGIPGNGTVAHIIAAQLSKNLNRPITVVPYKGTPQIVQAVLAGDIELGAVGIPQTVALASDGKLVPLAVDMPARHPTYPNLPTFSEFDLKQVANVSYSAILIANHANPTEIAKLRNAVKESLSDKEIIERFTKAGFITPNPILLPDNWLIKEKNRLANVIKGLDMSF